MELRHLRYFIAVAEAGSFSGAADVIRVSQPPLSVAIGQLEREFGTALFRRGSRGVQLTPAGRHFLEDAYRVIDEVDSMSERFVRFNRGETGQIRLAVVPSLIWSRLPAFLKEYDDARPDVDVQIFDPHPLGALEMLLARTADIAVVMTADNQRLSRNYLGVLEFQPWGELPLRAAFSASEGVEGPVSLSSFDGRTVFVPRRVIGVPSLAEVIDEALSTRNVRPRAKRTFSSSIPMAIPLVAAGVGVAILPEHVVGHAPASGVTMVEIDPPLRSLEVSAVWRTDAEVSPAVAQMRRMFTTGVGVDPGIPAR